MTASCNMGEGVRNLSVTAVTSPFSKGEEFHTFAPAERQGRLAAPSPCLARGSAQSQSKANKSLCRCGIIAMIAPFSKGEGIQNFAPSVGSKHFIFIQYTTYSTRKKGFRAPAKALILILGHSVSICICGQSTLGCLQCC